MEMSKERFAGYDNLSTMIVRRLPKSTSSVILNGVVLLRETTSGLTIIFGSE